MALVCFVWIGFNIIAGDGRVFRRPLIVYTCEAKTNRWFSIMKDKAGRGDFVQAYLMKGGTALRRVIPRYFFRARKNKKIWKNFSISVLK